MNMRFVAALQPCVPSPPTQRQWLYTSPDPALDLQGTKHTSPEEEAEFCQLLLENLRLREQLVRSA